MAVAASDEPLAQAALVSGGVRVPDAESAAPSEFSKVQSSAAQVRLDEGVGLVGVDRLRVGLGPFVCPGGRPVVVDVRRAREFVAPVRGWRKGFNALLLAEAAGLAALWDYGQAS